MKRILLISNMYPSEKYPHYGVFVENTEKLLISDGMLVSKSVMHKCDTVLGKMIGYIKLYLKSIMLGVFGKYDAVYAHFVSHTAFPLHVIRFCKPNIPIIVNAHGNDIWADTPHDEKNIQKSKKILPKIDGVIVPSEYYRNIVIKEYKIPDEKIKVFPSGGVNRNVFFHMNQDKAREHCRMKKESFYIGYISRIEKDKGWDVFLNAIRNIVDDKQIPNLRVLIVGDGTEKAEMFNLIRESGLQTIVDYRMLVSQQELVYHYNALDIFCFPTQRKSESLGLVGLEAMACEVPCIISAMPGTLTYAKEGANCFLFQPGNAIDLGNKMISMYRMKLNDKVKMENNQRLTVSQFDSDTVKESFVMDFKELIRKKEINKDVGCSNEKN